MMPQLNPDLFVNAKRIAGASAPATTSPVQPQAQSKQASPLAMPAMSANAAPAMPMPQPKAANPNPLGTAFDIFARGFAPKQTAASDEKFKADGMERNKKALAWMQQTAGLPAEQRAAFTLQSAQDIARDTGQSYEAVVASARDPNAFSDQALQGAIATFSAQLGIAPEKAEAIKYQSVNLGNAGVGSFDPSTGKMEVLREPSANQADGSDIRQVGNSIVQRQQDGSWKPVYTGSSPAETARAFQGFIDDATGEQMLVMSDGSVKGTGRNAYVPPQISSVGGVPVAVDKRTYETTELSPLENVAGNAAAMASAKVQGGAQGQVAFDLPVIEQRAQTAISSIGDLKQRNIGQRFGLQGKLYAIPGTDGADVQALVNQVTSQAFLNAFEQLKGGGAITEREGQAATQAITRLQNQNITVGEAITAMNELENYYRKGLDVARQRAVKAPVLPGRPAAAAGVTRTREGVPFLLAKPTPTSSTLTPEEQAELEALRAEFGQ